MADPDVESHAPAHSVGYRRLMLALLVAAYTANFIDRTIVASIGQAIKADLKLTDMQLGCSAGSISRCSIRSWASRSRTSPSELHA